MSDYDGRQLRCMVAKIEAYNSGALPLPALISDLSALLNVLEGKDKGWDVAFFDNWENLERIYSVNLYRNNELSPSQNETIDISLENIGKLIQARLSGGK